MILDRVHEEFVVPFPEVKVASAQPLSGVDPACSSIPKPSSESLVELPRSKLSLPEHIKEGNTTPFVGVRKIT
jgi:hypothetical protein